MLKPPCQAALRLANLGLLCILILALVISGQPVRAQDEVKSCARSEPPWVNGNISPGEYLETCHYELKLKGPWYDNGTPVDPPLRKNMTFYAMNDFNNVYLAYRWTHVWNNDTANDRSSPDNYVLISAFDFDADGLFEDNDNFAYTIDDGLGLLYLGFHIGNPNPPEDAWIKIYIPTGLYVISWNATADGIQVIGGPPPIPGTIWKGVQPAGPGPLDPAGSPIAFPYAAMRSPAGKVSGQSYTYTLEMAVPKVLFHRSEDLKFDRARFGIFLAQETSSTYVWTWPSDLDQWNWEVNEESAEVLGFLNDLDPGATGLLDPGPDPERRLPVGGTVIVDETPVLYGVFVGCAFLAFGAAALAVRRRRK